VKPREEEQARQEWHPPQKACLFGHELLPAEVERAYRRQLELGDQQAWPPPTGYWREDQRFVLTDGRNRFIASLMLGVEHLLVAWLVPVSS
jgi:hypothetical protein